MNDLAFYRCLGNPVRLAALKTLVKAEELCVTDLVEATGTEQSHMSHALAELRACGLVAARPDGKKVCYKVTSPRLQTILDLVERYAPHVACTDDAGCLKAGCCA